MHLELLTASKSSECCWVFMLIILFVLFLFCTFIPLIMNFQQDELPNKDLQFSHLGIIDGHEHMALITEDTKEVEIYIVAGPDKYIYGGKYRSNEAGELFVSMGPENKLIKVGSLVKRGV